MNGEHAVPVPATVSSKLLPRSGKITYPDLEVVAASAAGYIPLLHPPSPDLMQSVNWTHSAVATSTDVKLALVWAVGINAVPAALVALERTAGLVGLFAAAAVLMCATLLLFAKNEINSMMAAESNASTTRLTRSAKKAAGEAPGHRRKNSGVDESPVSIFSLSEEEPPQAQLPKALRR